MPINLPGDIAVDIRQPILGDSFNWSGLEPAAAKKVIVVHATAGQNPSEDGFSMAEQHVNGNGWGGIGVHFVVTHDNYPGRPGFTPAGAHAQYVGDLLTYRAGVANNNPGRVHIEICGLFTPGNGVPSEAQLRATKRIIDFLLAQNNVLPSLNFPSQVDYHNHQAIQPAGATACPGWQHPQFNEWFSYLQGGPEPSWFNHPAPAPQPIPVTVTPPPVDDRPEWEKTWNVVPVSPKVVAVPQADVFSFPQNKVVKTLPGGEPISEIAGTFTVNGQVYFQTKFSADRSLFNGILESEVKDQPSAQPVTPITNTGVPVDSIQAPPVVPETNVFEPETPVQPDPPQADTTEVGNALAGLWEAFVGLLMSPLRLVGIVRDAIKSLTGVK